MIKFRDRVVNYCMYYADTRSLNFAIENLCENEIISVTVLACSYGVQEEPFQKKNGRKSRETVPLALRSLNAHKLSF